MVTDDQALRRLAEGLGYRNLERYRARADFLFAGIPLEGKRVLDVGCGPGAWALWAATHGAAYVLGIEPEARGSTAGSLPAARHHARELNLSMLEFRSAALDELTKDRDGQFDVVILYDVINHIDETSVKRLHIDPTARGAYLGHLGLLRELTADGGTVIIADCARWNFWKLLRRQSPFAPGIEWEKHQQPGVWASLFTEAGFTTVDMRWSPLYPLGWLSQNALVQYLTRSHFTMRFRRRRS